MKIAVEIGDRAGEGTAYGNLGNAYQLLGDFRKAIEYQEEHLKIAKEIGDRAGEGRAYGNLGNTYKSLSDHRKAIEYHEKYLKIAKVMGDRAGEGRAYGNLGNDYDSVGEKSVIGAEKEEAMEISVMLTIHWVTRGKPCLLYTSPSPRDLSTSRMPSSA